MAFVVFMGTIEVKEPHGHFRRGAVHACVCVAPKQSEMKAILEDAHRAAKRSGFALKTVDGGMYERPAWAAWLPTEAGKTLRKARKEAYLIISEETGDPYEE